MAVRINKDNIVEGQPFEKGFLDWFSFALEYLSNAKILAKEIQDRKDWGTQKNGIGVAIYLFKHGLELAMKAYSIQFKIPIRNEHDLRKVGKEISLLLRTLPVDELENAFDYVEVDIQGKKTKLPQVLIYSGTLLYWEKKLPEIILKYRNHLYLGRPYPDPKNLLLRYPENPELIEKINSMKDETLSEIMKDIYDQFMLLQFVFQILAGQPVR